MNMTKHAFLLMVVSLLGLNGLEAQKSLSWKKHRNLAEDYFENGEYALAAENWEQAWLKKPKKEELIYKAGEAYFLTRNYRKAAEAYQNVKDQNDDYPLVGLKYARMLKQDGQYDQAIQAFQAFSDSYTGEGKSILDGIIRTEIEGAELGKTLPARADLDANINHIGGGINSEEQEFGPMPYSENELFFTSTMGGSARIYSSTRAGDDWTKGQTPANFPVIDNGQYAHGSLSPDGSRFYFTICEEDANFNVITTRCEIYFVQRQEMGWSAPQRLSDIINMQGFTATHPGVIYKGDIEILYFVSNRTGGRGGMDLWYATRPMNNPTGDFSTPVNLGPTINTLGDEVSPYYEAGEGTLYFSSNGHPGIGGFDIFSTRGDLLTWTTPDNLGLPYNSSADDYFFSKNLSGDGGFFASNRIFPGEKTATTDDDIYEFRTRPQNITLEGNVFDELTGEPLDIFTVNLYEVKADGTEMQLVSRNLTGNRYTFEVLPNREFRVEVLSDGYDPASYNFVTTDPSIYAYGEPLFLSREGDNFPDPEDPIDPPSEDPTDLDTPDRPVDPIENDGSIYTTRGIGPHDKVEYSTMAPRYRGEYYKVQLVALRKYDEFDRKFDPMREYGTLQTETILDRNLNRVLVGTFFGVEEARQARAVAQRSGFSSAFLVKYIDGERYGRVK